MTFDGQFSSRFAAYEPPAPKTRLESIFAEEPVSLETFIADQKFMNADWRLSPLQTNLVQHIERIFLPDLYPEMARGFGGYWAETQHIPVKNLITAQWGKGGGKDSTTRVGLLRVAYLLMCMHDPQRYFGIPTDDSIHMLNVAHNARQASNAFFTPLKGVVRRGWFADRAEAKKDVIEFDKNIYAISGHSDADSQEGLNLILGVADEIDAFPSANEQVGYGKKARAATNSAEAILKMLLTSASTRFPHTFKRVAISYPRYKGSMIQQLTEEARKAVEEDGDKSIFMYSGPYATWEVNPLRRRSDFDAYYKRDPEESAAMYECKPSLSSAPYYRNPEIFTLSTDREFQPLVIDYEVKEVFNEGRSTSVWEPKFSFASDFAPAGGASYVIHADLALTGDRAGVAMSHVVRHEERGGIEVDEESGASTPVTEMRPVVRNDFTVAFEADMAAQHNGKHLPREIQIRWVRALVFDLRKRGFRIVKVTYDSFQSADSMQILTHKGIEVDKKSTDKDQSIWRTVRDVASDSRLLMAYEALLIDELQSLTTIGRKVDHLPHKSKDLADAFACSIESAIEVGGSEDGDERAIVFSEDSIFDVGALGDAPRGLQGMDLGFPRGMNQGHGAYGHH